MKFPLLVLLVVILLALFGCGATPAQFQAASDQSSALAAQATATKAQLEQAKLDVQATTRPTIITPAPTATNPAPLPVVVPPTKIALDTEKKTEAVIDAATKALTQSTAALTATSNVLTSIATGNNPGPAITAAAPLGGPYALYVSLAGMAVTAVWGIIKSLQAKNATADHASAVDGIQAAIAQGQLTVTSAHAYATVDSAANLNDINSRLVDVIAAAPVKA